MTEEILHSLAAIPGVQVTPDAPMAAYTRFGLGGPAAVLADAGDAEAFIQALAAARSSGSPVTVIGGGTNLIIADEGFPGIVLRYRSDRIAATENRIGADAGADFDALVHFAVERGLKGLETMARIPGWVGGAVYGNAGAYGRSLSELVSGVMVTDGQGSWIFTRGECEFGYRESVFKRRKDWIVLSVVLALEDGDPAELARISEEIRRIRDEKFPPDMKCAGSIFKNLHLRDLPTEAASRPPESVIRDGKIPAAWFLDQAGAKGLTRGGIRVADYHANLVYNSGGGTSADLRDLIADLKSRVFDKFGINLEEEVQFVGFEER